MKASPVQETRGRGGSRYCVLVQLTCWWTPRSTSKWQPNTLRPGLAGHAGGGTVPWDRACCNTEQLVRVHESWEPNFQLVQSCHRQILQLIWTHLWTNFLTTSIPAFSSFRARMYSWVKRRSRGHLPKSCWRKAKCLKPSTNQRLLTRYCGGHLELEWLKTFNDLQTDVDEHVCFVKEMKTHKRSLK